MTTLDTLALSSANAIHTSVSGVRAPVAGIGGAAQTAALWRMAGYATAGAAALWDAGIWDAAIWTGDDTPFQPAIGAWGIGKTMALAIRGRSIVETTFIASGVMWDDGGLL